MILKIQNLSMLLTIALFILSTGSTAQSNLNENPIAIPQVGDCKLQIITPTDLELMLITTQFDKGKPQDWDFVKDGKAILPSAGEFVVKANGQTYSVNSVGFKRRVRYAPLEKYDLRIGCYIYLRLAKPLPDGAEVTVTNPSQKLWSPSKSFSTTSAKYRFSPAIHVNQVGYIPGLAKAAIIGYYFGTLGELKLGANQSFSLVRANDNTTVFNGKLTLQKDTDSGLDSPPYQFVMAADFSEFSTPGEYKVYVPGLGTSFPFFIDEGIGAAFTRAYALGMYHQRCGDANELPFTRFVHNACHDSKVGIPTKDITYFKMQQLLQGFTKDAKKEKRHTAPVLASIDASLYPYVKQGYIDATGGHHDAGDYSKYTSNIAELVHYLLFSAEALKGVGDLDNLGLPESGDGISDVLQLAKWEADLLSKLQDDDGGFYFMVYPRDKKYESHQLPDEGVPQVVYPKNTAVTAGAVAALAQAGSSPEFKKVFPEDAAKYLLQAKKGWKFIESALAKYGWDGSYQQITHYGDAFLHDDELVWAMTELFLATGDKKLHTQLIEKFDPDDRSTMQWKWWKIYKAYGCAIRSYAFAERMGRVKPGTLDQGYLGKCVGQIQARADDLVEWANGNAYNTSFPFPSKKHFNGSYYFPMESMFDAAVAYQLFPKKDYVNVMVDNLNFEGGTNPNNITFVTGLGWQRQHEIVSQYAQNDRRDLPPTGFPLGAISDGFAYVKTYNKVPEKLSYPPDDKESTSYPFYDRWGDSFNTRTEFVTVKIARCLAACGVLMNLTKTKNQAYKHLSGSIEGVPEIVTAGTYITAKLKVNNLDLSQARIVWETDKQEARLSQEFVFKPSQIGKSWVEVEAQWPDGRRVFAVREFEVK